MRILLAIFLAGAASVPAMAQEPVHVVDEAGLRTAIASVPSGTTIVFDANITLTGGDLPSIANSITVDGGGHTLSGGAQFRGLLVAGYGGVAAPGPVGIDVTIQNLTIADTLARGGNGGSGSAGGGGGAGLGGALFVGQLANVTLSNVNFSSNSAVGGNGGAGGLAGVDAGGGGGLGGHGGDGAAGFGGAGGGAGTGADAGAVKPGNPGILTGAGSGGDSGALPGGAQGGGGAGSGNGSAGGGDNGSQGGSGVGGSGGYGGGGAGGSGSSGGFGGMGGGGGGGVLGGFGGFGGGGGGATSAGSAGGAGFGGGAGDATGTAGGGGGAGMGGAVFVDGGGVITIKGNVSMNGNAVSAGTGATGGGDGSAFGSGLFFGGGGVVFFSSGAGETQTINDSIVDQQGASGLDLPFVQVVKDGAGTLVLNGSNAYAGGTFITDGTLQVASGAGLGIGRVEMSGISTLAVTGTTSFKQNFSLAQTPTVSIAAGQNATFAGVVGDNIDVPGASLTVTGGGTMTLANAGNSYTGGTTVIGNSTVSIGADGALGAGAAGVTLGDATSAGTISFRNNSAFTTDRSFTLGAGGGIFDTAGTAAIDVDGSISGSGGLAKTGTGTLTLFGANSYTGATHVAAGVLRAGVADAFNTNGAMQLDAGATLDLNGQAQTVGSLLGGGSVTLGAATFTTGGDGTSTLFSGAMSGTGDLVKTGAGTLTLTGANTYSGGTTVSGGTLAGTTDSLQGAILNNARVVFDQAANGIYAGNMNGTGALVKSGAGVVALTGANTYSGGTTVDGGTLAGTATSLQGNILNNAVVQFDQNAAGIFAGVMNGTGALVKSGTGTLTLTGANSYTGGTLISGGTLAGDTASIQGNIVDNAQLVFNQAADGVFGGTIAGSGSLTKTGAGTLTLSGVSAYTGGTTVSAGTLAGTSLSLQGTIQDDAAVVFNQNFAGVFGGSIAGTGSVTKSGFGALFLAGANTYSGGTIVSGGSLIGTTASLQGGIQNNAQVVFSQNTNGTYAGAMSGTGSLVKLGAGTLTLSGANSYSGGTAIAGGGAVAVATDAALGAATGGVSLGDAASAGTLTFTNSGLFSSARAFQVAAGGGVFNTIGASPVTIGGAVTGTGSLTKTGDGVLVLSGANSYTGATTVAAGTLRAGGANVFGGTTALFVSTGTALDLNGFNQSIASIGGTGSILLGSGALTTGGDGSSSVFGGTISGAGRLVKTGGGTLVLTGANTYGGGTEVSSGALVGNTTSLQGNIFNNALVQFDQNNDGTYGGSMSGSGALAKTGAGTLTLSGNNTYSGGTIINGGSVIGTASSLRGFIVNNAQLTLGGSADGTFSGTLAGTGRVTKTGTGTLTLNGTQSMSGLFSVSQGTLAVTGIFAGSLDVASGAALRANGLVAGSLNLAGSLFAVPPPGTSSTQSTPFAAGHDLEGPSFLTIGQNFVATPGSLIDFAIGPGTNPTMVVGGTASLNGTRLNITAPSIGNARSESFLALAALNGLSMVNSDVITADANVVPVLKQDRNSLFVTLLNLNVPLGLVSSPRTVSVADAIDRSKFGAGGDAQFVVRELTGLNDAALGNALEQIAGQLHPTVLQTAVIDTDLVNDVVREQFQAREMEGIADIQWWGETACQHANFKANDNARGGAANVCTGAGGADRKLSDRWMIGGGGSWTGGAMGLGSMGSGDYTAPRAFGYVGYKPSRFGIRGGGSAAHSNYKTKRQIVFQALLPAELGGGPLMEGIDRTAEAEQTGTTTDSWGEIQDSRKVRTYTFEALLGIRHQRISRSAFSETGAQSLSLDALEQVLNLTQTDIRLHAWRRTGSYRPFFNFNYRRELAEGDSTTDMTFAGLPNSDFQVQGIGIPANTYSGKMGVTFVPLIGEATFTYEFKIATGQRRHTAGVRVRF